MSREQKAKTQIHFASNSIIGGYENAVSDGQLDKNDLPSLSELIDEIYYDVIHNYYPYAGCIYYDTNMNQDLKFCGKLKLRAWIKDEILLDGYWDE